VILCVGTGSDQQDSGERMNEYAMRSAGFHDDTLER
jgi:hypothetical protein